MSDIRLTTPEGYFEKSMARTMASVERIRTRRKAMAACFVAVLIATGAFFSGIAVRNSIVERDYYAMEAEQAQLDIFLEVNM